MQENDNNNNEKKKTLFAALCFISQLNWGLMQENCFFGTFNTPLHYPLQLQMYDKQTNERMNTSIQMSRQSLFLFSLLSFVVHNDNNQNDPSNHPSIHRSFGNSNPSFDGCRPKTSSSFLINTNRCRRPSKLACLEATGYCLGYSGKINCKFN